MDIFSPITIRDLELRNRMWLPAMCQFQVDTLDGMPNSWHLMHYGARAVGGFGLVIAEATAVVPEGRISVRDTGLWSHEHIMQWHPITSFVHLHGGAIAVQLAHAGRKAETETPVSPESMTHAELLALPDQFAEAARAAVAAGFDAVEIHAAHGYLLHQFLSPLSNQRIDGYGGSFAGRTRMLLDVLSAVRDAIPEGMPLLVRISATDWIPDRPSWDLQQSIELAQLLQKGGADVLDVSSGGLVEADIPVAPNYQTDLAAEIRRETGMLTAGVGLITTAEQAQGYLDRDELDVVLIGRAALNDPHWPLHAAQKLGGSVPIPRSYKTSFT
ncbi:NADH:flavin oxidoreductase/NADH oxidase [Corynebacterium hindlerae]|uniref:NADH:flavin oxidoreductase/NADH oxidase n=1 Tax=Corynebacterium hindlerae TaxID=699041 RepID=UPI0031B6B01E